MAKPIPDGLYEHIADPVAHTQLPTRAQADAYAVELAKRWIAAHDAGLIRSAEGKFMAEALIKFHLTAGSAA